MRDLVEFRIAISPTEAFFRRVRLLCAALQRLGPPYSEAPVKVVVGDDPDIERVRTQNDWSDRYHVEWVRLPSEIFADHYYFGTADYRYLLPPRKGALVILLDHDVVAVRPFLAGLKWMRYNVPSIAGHRAHTPPPVRIKEKDLITDDVWKYLFNEFGIPWPEHLYRYTIDKENVYRPAPAYYNLGFIALNQRALKIFRDSIFDVQARLRALVDSKMRCQIAVTLISYLHRMRRQNLPATFNAANDEDHLLQNDVRIENVKIIHYLRNDEVDRDTFLTDEERPIFLRRELRNPVNQLLQRVIRELPDFR